MQAALNHPSINGTNVLTPTTRCAPEANGVLAQHVSVVQDLDNVGEELEQARVLVARDLRDEQRARIKKKQELGTPTMGVVVGGGGGAVSKLDIGRCRSQSHVTR